ncbi:MAG: S41 family peptidase [Rhodospirillales bacterium]|nr:S41 family peptidase [Rhodospirillales bacterium]
MHRSRRLQARVLASAFLLALGLLAGLGACGSGDSSLSRVLGAIGVDPYPISEQGSQELQRFYAVYREFATADDSNAYRHFRDAFRRVRASYVYEVSDAALVDAAIKGVRDKKPAPRSLPPSDLVEAALDSMVTSLDAHSAYLNAQAFQETRRSMSNEFGGLGIEVTMENELVKVVSPIEDTPAARAGIKTGDIITHVDNESMQGRGLMYAVERMRGRIGSEIAITISREGRAPFTVTLMRATIKVQSVRWRTEGDVGYIRIARFTEKTDSALEEALNGIHSSLGRRLRGIVLDMRNNPGGLLDQSLTVADSFLDRGPIVSVKGRLPESNRTYAAEKGDLARGAPIVVLINGGSASASEIVASALQDHGRAVVMGTRSFGKGSVQSITPLPIQGGLRLTTAIYYSPSGRPLQALGVEPDIILAEGPSAEAELKREADLPRAIRPLGGADGHVHRKVREQECPAVGEKQDRPLGCALALLKAGSVESFLAGHGRQGAM